jgi:hypothetical protein
MHVSRGFSSVYLRKESAPESADQASSSSQRRRDIDQSKGAKRPVARSGEDLR